MKINKHFGKIIYVGLLLFLIPFIAQAQDQSDRTDESSFKPDYHLLSYSDDKPFNTLNIYLSDASKRGELTPLYVWAHGNGGSSDSFNEELWIELNAAGISAISWDSISLVQTDEDRVQCENDLLKVMDFIFENSDIYNFDTDKIVIGGTSRGSFITWEYAHLNPEIVKGIYSTGALGDPLLWMDRGWEPRDAIHKNSPPLVFAYPHELGYGNIHNPKSGLLIQEKYEELGMAYLARVEHSLNKRGLNRWAFIADFILAVTPD